MAGVSNDQIFATLLEIKGDIGELGAGVKANSEHTLAVSRKADAICADLDIHKQNAEAHGIEAERRGRGGLAYAIGAVLGGIVYGIAIFKFFLWIK